MIGPALSTRLPFETDETTVLGSQFRAKAPRARSTPGSKPTAPSSSARRRSPSRPPPPTSDGVLVPRPMSLRVFLARTPQGWQVMQGGFARIGSAPDAERHRHAARRHRRRRLGGQPKRPVETVTMLPATAAPYARVRPGVLPSRAGDNLYWLGRYVERAEGAMRLMRAYHVRLAETADPRGAAARPPRRLPRRRSASTPPKACPRR